MTEVSGEIFHEMRCESGKMTCCAPHCDEHMYRGRQQGTAKTTTAPAPTRGHATWPPPSQHEDIRGRDRTTTTTSAATTTGGGIGGLWSNIVGFWNQPADWHERERRHKHGHQTSQATHGQGQSGQGHWEVQGRGQGQSGKQVSYERSMTYNVQGQPAASGHQGQYSYQQQPSGQGAWSVTTYGGQPGERNVSYERSMSYSGASTQGPPPSSFSLQSTTPTGWHDWWCRWSTAAAAASSSQ